MKLLLVAAFAAMLAVAAGQACSSQGVTDGDSCNSQCSGDFCSCTFASVNGAVTCGCSNGFACSDGGAISIGDDDFGGNFFSDDDGVPDINTLRQAFVFFLGERCESAVNRAITNRLINCFAEGAEQFALIDSDDDGIFSEATLNVVCRSNCISTMFRAVNILYDADCLNFGLGGDDDFFGGDDDDEGGLDFIFGEFGLLEAYEDQLNVACTRGGNTYCGLLYDTLGIFYENPEAFGAAECQKIVDAGNCLGTIRAALDANVSLFGDDITVNTSVFIAGLNDVCSAAGVTGVSEAAASTERPANLASSAATTVSAVVAAVTVGVAAFILA